MKHIEEMKQLKKEYQEIPIPEHGIDGVKAAIEKARKKKRLRKRLVSYASMAAAAMLVVFVAPGVMLSMFAGGSANESASMGYDSMGKDMLNGGIKAESDAVTEPWYSYEKPAADDGAVAPGWFPEASEQKGTWASAFSDEATREKIEAEMSRQIRVRGLGGEEALAAIGASSELLDFEEKDADHYLDENGQLVIVFPAGELAPEKYGEIKFIIPDEVWK
ncbi:MAG: DUF3298 domain-containing protein [Lachnospiraceae bacterium]|nr:DUF3298 domain-containing protein [Lachnospiraceae bacterium]